MKGLAAGLVLVTQAVAAAAPPQTDVARLLSALEPGGYAEHERPPDFVGRTPLG